MARAALFTTRYVAATLIGTHFTGRGFGGHRLGNNPGSHNQPEPIMPSITQVVLFTDTDGRARFREESLPLDQGTPQSALTPLMPSGGFQLRQSPVGFRSSFHCTTEPQWVFILQGQMEISLQDGSSRVFKSGEHFYSADTLPTNQSFDETIHGHWSRQVGSEALVTLFVRG